MHVKISKNVFPPCLSVSLDLPCTSVCPSLTYVVVKSVVCPISGEFISGECNCFRCHDFSNQVGQLALPSLIFPMCWTNTNIFLDPSTLGLMYHAQFIVWEHGTSGRQLALGINGKFQELFQFLDKHQHDKGICLGYEQCRQRQKAISGVRCFLFFYSKESLKQKIFLSFKEGDIPVRHFGCLSSLVKSLGVIVSRLLKRLVTKWFF